jgi:hypothetical protein
MDAILSWHCPVVTSFDSKAYPLVRHHLTGKAHLFERHMFGTFNVSLHSLEGDCVFQARRLGIARGYPDFE